MRNPLDHPLVDYLIISVISLAVALICFKLGGSLAEVSGTENNFLGVTFKASGALGGFFLVFLLSQKAIEKLRRDAATRRENWTIPVKVYVEAEPDFHPPATKYKCEATVINDVTGETRTLNLEPRWEAGFLTVSFRDVTLSDFLGAMITDDRNQQWQLEDFRPFTHNKEATLLFNRNARGNGGGENDGAEA